MAVHAPCVHISRSSMSSLSQRVRPTACQNRRVVGPDLSGDGAPPSAWRAALRGALAPHSGSWAVGPGVRAAIAAGVVLGGSVVVADLRLGGIAYLGVACAVSFVGRGDYRSRAAMVAGQAVGAVVGMTVGALVPNSMLWVIVASVVVGVLAGAIGTIGPASTAGAVMAVIGVAYTQFGRLEMPWWEPVLAYVVGSALLLALSLVGAVFHRERYRTAAVSAVFDAAADLLDAAPGGPTEDARHRLASASADARVAAAGYRTRPVTGQLAETWSDARDAAARAAQIAVARIRPTPQELADLSRGWRRRADELRRGSRHLSRTAPTVSWVPAPAARMRMMMRAATRPDALWTGARIGVCVGIATTVAIALHPPQHAFWIPLTVAVVLRPEYGAVLVRSLHRLAGTVVGVVVVALLLAVTLSTTWLALAAAGALGLAALSAPRLYGLAVVGITGSALLSIAVADPGGLEPWARLLDTVLGCAIALVAGVLLWPRRGLPNQARAFGRAVAVLARQVDLELGPDSAPSPRAAATEEAYRVGHAWRAELERDLAEPDPSHAAPVWLPVAMQLERTVDAVCAVGARLRETGGGLPSDRRTDLLELLRGQPESGSTPARAEELLAAVTARLNG
ncbi:MAG: hypothetical protein QOH17_4752 [Pseudonocardiales bacterium]|nr:hypothetical protein [Pseudonocardiales bacterium]